MTTPQLLRRQLMFQFCAPRRSATTVTRAPMAALQTSSLETGSILLVDPGLGHSMGEGPGTRGANAAPANEAQTRTVRTAEHRTWQSRAGGQHVRVTTTTLSWDVVPIDKPDDVNVVIGQSHFIKTVEDLHEAIVGVSSSLRFGLAFCEASGPRLVRRTPAMILNWSSSRPAMRWPSPPGTAS